MTTQALFKLDLNRCTGCSACAVACTIENKVDAGMAWRQIHTYNAPRIPGTATYHLSLACNHCVDPACMRGCPAAAYTKDALTGAVLLNQDRCIGCGYCAWVCPYDAPQMNAATGVMEKCTFCSHRLAKGREPACVQACPVDALGFDPAGQPATQDLPGFPDTGLLPAITFTPKRGSPVVKSDQRDQGDVRPATPRLDFSKLRSEWPLLAFSLILTGMVAWLWSALSSGGRVNGFGFVLAAASAMMVSTLHLGRPTRAWRAALNVRTSWVSREIVFFSAFCASASAALIMPLPRFVTWIGAASGLIALCCVDLVYRVPGQRFAAVPHGAMTSLTAAYLFGLTLPSPWIALVAGALKLALYPWRAAVAGELPYSMTLTRVGLGFAWPLIVWFAQPSTEPLLLVAGPVIAEIVDRARFYAELSFMSPGRQIAQDLAKLRFVD